ncbi:MAG: flagellar hook-length control protein FliK [Brevundimonas sp.]|uniref:flagellar hook-length control protein FliK n=1 Tax=Brevundimonas sp. TaxID=1871086 RepID=UPI00391DD84B
MSIASALFAPAAPVSTGTTAAASGIEANDVGLFSSKVASVLDAGLSEAQTVKSAPIGRLTAPRPLGLVLNQAVAEGEAISSPAIETAFPAAPGAVDTKVQPAVSDEPAVVEDAVETDNTAEPAAVFSVVPVPQSTPLAIAASSSTPQPLVAKNSAVQTDIGLAIAANSSTPPPLVAENSAVQAGIGATSTVPVAPKAETPVEQSRASFIAATPTLSTSKTPDDAASIDVSAPDTSTNLGAKDAAEITLPEGFTIAAEAETARADLNIMAAAKAALPIMNAAPAVSDTASKTSEDAPVDATPAQSYSTAAPKKSQPEVASAPLDQSMTKAVWSPVNQTRVAAPDAAKVAVQAAPSDNDKSAAASIVQAMTAAQIPTADVQVSVMAQISKPVPLATADVAAAVIAAELSAEPAQPASDQQPAAAPADKPAPVPSVMPQAAPSIRAARHELAQQTSNAATTPAQPDTTNGTATPLAKADATPTQTTAQPVKTAEMIAASLSSPAPAAPEAQASSTVPADTQSVQQAVAPDRDLGLSTLSRATVETTAQLAAQIARKLDGRSTRFDMVLTPEDLGRVDVSLEIGKDGQLSARLAFDNPAAAADLKGRADELRRQLQDAGFQVAGDALDFSQRDPSSGGGAFERQQQRNALFAGGSRLAAQADTPIIPAPGAWINHSQTPDRVDVKV